MVKFMHERTCRINTGFHSMHWKCSKFKDRLLKEGISAILNDFNTTVVFERHHDHKFIHCWQLCYLSSIKHVVVMAGITREIIYSFHKDLMQEQKKGCHDETTLPPSWQMILVLKIVYVPIKKCITEFVRSPVFK